MQVVFISDTHGQHDKLTLPPGDILIHGGDLSKRGDEHEIDDFLHWYEAQPHPYKVFIAGNHDFFFEQEPQRAARKIPDNVIYLNDNGREIEGIYIWGSPIQPTFFDWAFNRDRGEQIQKHWDLIPSRTNILVTHGPPYGALDRTTRNEQVGCFNLTRTVQQIKPQYHLFGHIHEGYGMKQLGQTTFVNGSVLDEHYSLANEPVVFQVKN